jgi:hypothetical protein
MGGEHFGGVAVLRSPLAVAGDVVQVAHPDRGPQRHDPSRSEDQWIEADLLRTSFAPLVSPQKLILSSPSDEIISMIHQT